MKHSNPPDGEHWYYYVKLCSDAEELAIFETLPPIKRQPITAVQINELINPDEERTINYITRKIFLNFRPYGTEICIGFSAYNELPIRSDKFKWEFIIQ